MKFKLLIALIFVSSVSADKVFTGNANDGDNFLSNYASLYEAQVRDNNIISDVNYFRR